MDGRGPLPKGVVPITMAKTQKSPQSAGKGAKKSAPAAKPITKSELVAELQKRLGGDTTKALVNSVLDALAEEAASQIRAVGAFVVPGVARLKVRTRPAAAERQGINPKTKEAITIPARPAQLVVAAKVVAAIRDSI